MSLEELAHQPHGVAARYERGCHCDLCRAANTAKVRRHRRRRRERERACPRCGYLPAAEPNRSPEWAPRPPAPRVELRERAPREQAPREQHSTPAPPPPAALRAALTATVVEPTRPRTSTAGRWATTTEPPGRAGAGAAFTRTGEPTGAVAATLPVTAIFRCGHQAQVRPGSRVEPGQPTTCPTCRARTEVAAVF